MAMTFKVSRLLVQAFDLPRQLASVATSWGIAVIEGSRWFQYLLSAVPPDGIAFKERT
jgi:hypothetical protein